MGVRSFGPGVLEREAVGAGDRHREHELRGAKAGGVDDAVDLALGAVGAHHSAFGQAGDRLGHQLHVLALQRGQEPRAEQDPLAAERVVGPRLATDLRVAQLPAHEQRGARPADLPPRPRVADHQRQRLGVLVEAPAPQALDRRSAPEQRLAASGDRRGSCAVGTSCRCAGRRTAARPAPPPRARTARRSRRCRSRPRACRASRSGDPSARSGSCGRRTSSRAGVGPAGAAGRWR